jgi:D-sedoheptulose 7-phosphate isomerase
MKNRAEAIIRDAQAVVTSMSDPNFVTTLDTVGQLLVNASQKRQTIFIGGNGGSWADADHFAGEIRAQFEVKGRPALPAVAVPVSLTTLTAWGNDYEDGFTTALERDLQALSKPGDIFIAISTSGKAQNIRSCLAWAKQNKLTTVAISGNGPLSAEFGGLADHHIQIPHQQTARIQEAYQIVIHILCCYIDSVTA